MKATSVPKPLRERLGDEATVAFVEVLNRQRDQMTDDIAKAVVHALEPRFASIDRRFESIEARLDECATKADLAACATKADLAACATKSDLSGLATKADLTGVAAQPAVERLAEKQEAFAVALERGLGGIRADMAGFAMKADLTGFATQTTVDRLAEKQETFAVALERGFGGIRADMAGQRADMMKWMFLFWVGQAFVVLAYLRAAQ